MLLVSRTNANAPRHELAIQLPKDLDLLLYIVYLIFRCFEVNDLDCYGEGGPFVVSTQSAI